MDFILFIYIKIARLFFALVTVGGWQGGWAGGRVGGFLGYVVVGGRHDGLFGRWVGGMVARWLAGCRLFALGRVGDCQRSERNATGKPVALVTFL